MSSIQQGSVGTPLGTWLSVIERLGLLSKLDQLSDPASKAIIQPTPHFTGPRIVTRSVIVPSLHPGRLCLSGRPVSAGVCRCRQRGKSKIKLHFWRDYYNLIAYG